MLKKDNRGNNWEASRTSDWQKTERYMREGIPSEATHLVEICYIKATGEPTTEAYAACDLDEYSFYVAADSIEDIREAYPISSISEL
jgi:hypothetical protein